MAFPYVDVVAGAVHLGVGLLAEPVPAHLPHELIHPLLDHSLLPPLLPRIKSVPRPGTAPILFGRDLPARPNSDGRSQSEKVEDRRPRRQPRSCSRRGWVAVAIFRTWGRVAWDTQVGWGHGNWSASASQPDPNQNCLAGSEPVGLKRWPTTIGKENRPCRARDTTR